MTPRALPPESPSPRALPLSRRLLDARDWALMLVLMLVGLLLRLHWWSGYGLRDDSIFRVTISNILSGEMRNAFAYRATWWLPTVVTCRVLGMTEACLILPVTAVSTLGIGLVYAFGKALWDRPGAVIAALLLLVHPLDFAWSTMFANDFFQSFFAALAVLLFLRATEVDGSTAKRRCFFFAALCFFLAYHAKIIGATLGPAFVLIAWWRRDRVLPEVSTFLGVCVLLFGLSALASVAVTGTPFGPYEIEKWLSGLSTADTTRRFSLLTWERFLTWPRLFFTYNWLGDLTFSVYPHLLVLFVLCARPLGLRSSKEVWAWFLAVFLPMQFQFTYSDGVWGTMFRNIRHIHAVVYPMVLLLAGYFVSLAAVRPRLAGGILAVLLLFSTWMSIRVASKTHEAFGDMRAVAQFIATLPRKPIHADTQLDLALEMAGHTPDDLRGLLQPLEPDPEKRRAQIAALRDGYLVTGGAGEPYYGCYICVPDASEVPADRWRLLKTFPGPAEPTPWRREPPRVWEAVPDTP